MNHPPESHPQEVSLFVRLPSDSPDLIIKEWQHYPEQLGELTVRSVFLTGVMDAKTIEQLIDIIPIFGNIEITAEHPAPDVWQPLKEAGVNRLSLTHYRDDAHARFKNLNVDVLYTPSTPLDDIHLLIQNQVPHISLYEEEPTPDFYDQAADLLRSNGYNSYDAFHFCTPSYESLHQQRYLDYQSYIALGSGGHGRFWRDDVWMAAQTLEDEHRWATAVREIGHGVQALIAMSQSERDEERKIAAA